MTAFVDDRHAIYVGWVCGMAVQNGVAVRPITDDAGNYTDTLEIVLPDEAWRNVTVTVVVPPPPDDWVLP